MRAIALFVMLSIMVPLWHAELYPFSRAPMFSDASQRCCDYKVFSPDGRSLDPRQFAVQRNYWGNPLGVGVGFLPADTVDRFGEVPEKDSVKARVSDCLIRHPELEFVEVIREVIGPFESGGIGPIQTDIWRIENPLYRKVSDQ